jgi:hypothetical protein
MPTPINAPPKRGYKAVHYGDSRPAAQVAYLVVHSGEAPTAEIIARWFANPASGGSTQLAFDCDETYRMLSDLVIPHGAPPLNSAGLHGELAGISAWTPAGWLRRKRMLQRAAWWYAEWSILFGVPVRWLNAKQLLKHGAMPGHGQGGITSHAEISKAWKRTDHSDPGPGFETAATGKLKAVPRRLFMGYVKKYRKQILAPPKPKPKKKAKPPLSSEQATRPANQERDKR